MATIYAFIKIFEQESHAKDFISGKLFMNTIRSFKEYKDLSGELRGDEYEGIVALYQPKELGEIKFGNITIPASELAAPIVVHGNDLLNSNVFCIYSLNSSGHESISSETLLEFRRTIELHESCFGLGKFCVVILNASEFLLRCRTALEKLNLGGTMGLVEYFNEHEFHGNFDPKYLGYHKRSLFKRQREYRIKVNLNNHNPGHYFLEVGNLSDIAILTTPQEFNSQLEIGLPDGSKA
jgi:hypothetical protein